MRQILLLGLLAIAACAEKPTQPTPVDQRIVLAPGQTAAVPSASLSVRFETVVSDSRCPATALCITAGDAVVRIDLVPDRGSQRSVDLHRTSEPRAANHDGLTVTLVELSPYPLTFNSIPAGDYRATFQVTR
jgi:hypothetical protein